VNERIKELAQMSGLAATSNGTLYLLPIEVIHIEHFAELVRQDEREQAEKQEPVAYIDHVSGKPKFINGYVVQTDYNIPLYTSPPSKEWVGLTKDEVLTTWLSSDTRKVPQCDKHHHFYVAIEAKLRERNT